MKGKKKRRYRYCKFLLPYWSLAHGERELKKQKRANIPLSLSLSFSKIVLVLRVVRVRAAAFKFKWSPLPIYAYAIFSHFLSLYWQSLLAREGERERRCKNARCRQYQLSTQAYPIGKTVAFLPLTLLCPALCVCYIHYTYIHS